MRCFLDMEWNDWQGEDISLALVSERYGDDPLYLWNTPTKEPSAWVAEHVMRRLHAGTTAGVPEVTRLRWGAVASAWVNRIHQKYNEPVTIVADWPDDIARFCRCLIVGPGTMVTVPPLTFELAQGLPGTAQTSRYPHNALYDAVALRDAYLTRVAPVK
jgi:hypothetical protein